MNAEDFQIREADWEQDRATLHAIRTRVFVEEQAVPAELEWDHEDPGARHFLAFSGGEAVGTARLLPSGQIGRMAVLPSHRGLGIGRALLDAAVEAAQQRGEFEVFLNAQTRVLRFYQAAGFRRVGGEFEEAGIPHVRMERPLGLPFEPPRDVPAASIRAETRDDYPLPPLREYSPEVRRLRDQSAIRRAVLDICRHARREVLIFSQDLDPPLFDDPELVDTLSNFARRHPHSRVDVVVHDVRRMLRQGHGVLELSRRLGSSVHILVVHPEMRSRGDTFVVVDATGLVVLPLGNNPQGFVNLNHPALASQYVRIFEQLWERARPDPELRRLAI